MKIQKMVVFGLSVSLMAFSLHGCVGLEEGVRNNPRTTTGAAVGAAGGAVAGGLLYKNATGAIVGGLLGGLAGGLIGNVMETRSQDYESTARDYKYTPSRGPVVRIEQVGTEPARLHPGETVELVVRYALLTPNPQQEVKIVERWDITKDGQSTGNPVHTVRREAGTWVSRIPVDLPRNTPPGAYQVAVTVDAGNIEDSKSTSFNVRRR